ncbi:beta-lactamase family protein [Pseudoflavitalea sp. G-6-1-2]|nr:serine hydrolase [Pseudoflavitalea sp. G-6-1-2]NML21440.1 beta-lactamase family protein [Pseudoflavitalea sp. G-6-1-2]
MPTYRQFPAAGCITRPIALHNDGFHLCSCTGATGLQTSATEFASWMRNFFYPLSGNSQTLDMLTTNGSLNNGTQLKYALGIGEGSYLGWKLYAHSGSDAAFRTTMFVYPEQNLGIAIFCNRSDMKPADKAIELSSLLLKPHPDYIPPASLPTIDSNNAEPACLSCYNNFIGKDYIADNGVQCSIIAKNGRIYWRSFGEDLLLKELRADSLVVVNRPQTTLVFQHATKKSGSLRIRKYTRGEERIFRPIQLTTPQSEDIRQYQGTYFSKELGIHCRIIWKGNIEMSIAGTWFHRFKFVGVDDVLSEDWPVEHIVFQRNKRGKITGFAIYNVSVQQILFSKIR